MTKLNEIIDVQDIRDQGKITLKIEATPEECAALAERCDILAVDDLKATITLKSGKGSDLVKVEAKLVTNIQQACSVTLAPVKEAVSETFSETLTTNEALLESEEDTDENENQPVELIENEKMDIGELIAQWLVVSMNPYPRSETPFYEHIEVEETTEGEKKHKPFAFLEQLTKK